MDTTQTDHKLVLKLFRASTLYYSAYIIALVLGRVINYISRRTIFSMHADFISIGFEAPAGQTYASTADLGKFMAMIFNDDKPFNPQAGQV